MTFPIERYKDVQGWIPESDIDGIDAKKEFVADCINADFENGSVRGCITPSFVILPVELINLVTAGYEILDGKQFYHSTQGNILFFILWKDSVPSAKFVVWEKDNNITTELNLDVEGVGDITFLTKPSIISWGLTEDQLKINLNITATYNKITKSPILNLTFAYYPTEKVYVPVTSKYDAGWYLFPRWLGWSYGKADTHALASVYFLNDTPDFSYPTVNTSSGFRHTDPKITWFHNGYGDSFYDYGFHANAGQTATLRIEGFCALGQMSYEASNCPSVTLTIKNKTGETILVDTQVVTGIINPVIDVYAYSDGFIIEFNWADNGIIQHIMFGNIQSGRNNYPDNTWRSSVIVVAKYRDGQRALLYNPNISESDDIGLENTLYLYVNKYAIDWRIEEYELYGLTTVDSNIYSLIGTVPIDGTWVSYSGSVWKKRIEFKMSTTTLNFNYGLGSTVRVDEQVLIYDEASYKGRTYTVKGTEKVYQSHISGTGRAQPDSFPYDEKVEFGYFITNRDERNLALAVTNIEELFIIGKQRDYTYFIEGNVGTVFRTLKKNEGGKPILSRKSFVKSLSGSPMTETLFWTDDDGAYLYGGGKNPPLDVMLLNFRNYWKALGNRKDNAIAFFNKPRTEFWIVLDDRIIVYEPNFKMFKKYIFDFIVKSYLGFDNGVHYFLATDNTLRTWDSNSTVRMNFEIECHYNTNTVVMGDYPVEAPEHELKILQEIYTAVKEASSGIIKYRIIADENTYDDITFMTGILTDVLPSPLLLLYGKIKVRLLCPHNINLREFGYSFSVPGQQPYQQVRVPIKGIGMSSGADAGIGL